MLCVRVFVWVSSVQRKGSHTYISGFIRLYSHFDWVFKGFTMTLFTVAFIYTNTHSQTQKSLQTKWDSKPRSNWRMIGSLRPLNSKLIGFGGSSKCVRWRADWTRGDQTSSWLARQTSCCQTTDLVGNTFLCSLCLLEMGSTECKETKHKEIWTKRKISCLLRE